MKKNIFIIFAIIFSLFSSNITNATEIDVNIFNRKISKFPDTENIKWYQLKELNDVQEILKNIDESKDLNDSNRDTFNNSKQKNQKLLGKKVELKNKYDTKFNNLNKKITKLWISIPDINFSRKDEIKNIHEELNNLSEEEKSHFKKSDDLALIETQINEKNQKFLSIENISENFKKIVVPKTEVTEKEKTDLLKYFSDLEKYFNNLDENDKKIVKDILWNFDITETKNQLNALKISKNATPSVNIPTKTVSSAANKIWLALKEDSRVSWNWIFQNSKKEENKKEEKSTFSEIEKEKIKNNIKNIFKKYNKFSLEKVYDILSKNEKLKELAKNNEKVKFILEEFFKEYKIIIKK